MLCCFSSSLLWILPCPQITREVFCWTPQIRPFSNLTPSLLNIGTQRISVPNHLFSSVTGKEIVPSPAELNSWSRLNTVVVVWVLLRTEASCPGYQVCSKGPRCLATSSWDTSYCISTADLLLVRDRMWFKVCQDFHTFPWMHICYFGTTSCCVWSFILHCYKEKGIRLGVLWC